MQFPFFSLKPSPIMVDRLCEQAMAIAVIGEVCRQQSEEIDRLRRAAKAHARLKRKDSATYIAEYVTTTGRLMRLAGRQ